MEAGGSSKTVQAKNICSNGLIHHLFSWTLEDILYNDFYKDKVQNIPESFESVHQYLGAYLFPLLEETKAELSLGLKAIHKAPFARLVSIEEPKSSDKLLLDVSVDSWRNTTKNGGKESYRTLPGDIFLILGDKPNAETVMNLQCSTRTWAFAWVNQIIDNGYSAHLKLNVSKNIIDEHGMQKEFFIVFLMSITTNLRIWNSLHSSEDAKIIKHILSKKSMGDEICDKCSLYNNSVCAEKLGTSLSSVLNDSQSTAVLCSVCKTLCDHTPSLELIWGPPGTGKTKTVSFLLWKILEMKQRILACAPTNVAITELASRVVQLLRESSRAGGVLCSLGNMLLFGNKDRLKVGSELEEIYLDYRVDRLVECFGQSGWKYHTTSLIKLLESSNSEYLMLLKSNVNMSISFLGFIREKFKSTASTLRECLKTLITHIPKQFILEHNVQYIEILLDLIDSFGMLLSQDNITSEQMEMLFSSPEIFIVFPNSSVTATFVYLRSNCLSILKILQASLNQLQLPSTANRESLKKFCFQRASLILCTASSSFQLNFMKMDPVNLLVIDEAAQLKECESIVPLQLPGIKHAILIGDECQLPAIVCSQICDAAGYGRSLFERLSLLGHSKHLLNTQYRMHPSISCFPNSKFYSNQILDAPLVMAEVHTKCYIPSPMFGPYTFINVSVGKEEGDDDGHSKKNTVEVAVVIKIIEKLYKAWRNAKTRLSIGVISFYAAQVSEIQGRLGHKYEKSNNFTVKVKSVDGFQGGEEDVIILTTVRSNRRKNIGFISSSQRINVALTRARHCLWIVGDATTLGNSNSEWEAVVSNAKDRQCYFNAEEDKDFADAIIEVKKVLLELDDLLTKDSVLFTMAQWKVLLSDSFRASFQNVVSINQKKSIIVLLLRLSCGWRPETDYVSHPICSNIIKCFKAEGLFIIYSLDIEKDLKHKQILKIWDIKPLTDVKVLVDCLSNLHELYTDDFLNLCKAKSHKGDLELPITWSASHDIAIYKDHMKAELNAILNLQADSDDTQNITLKKNLLQMKFQSLSYQKTKHLLSGRDSKELDLPCQVEDEELEIILFPTSAFIIGRPGSGKTAAMTIKLFMREYQQQIHPRGCSPVTGENAEVRYRNEGGEECKKIERTDLRQLFITVTLKQCLHVKERLLYLERISNGGNTFEERQDLYKVEVLNMNDVQDLLGVPNSFDGIPVNSYPLVITFRKFLIMLDRTVGDSYFMRFLKQWRLSCDKSRDPLSTAACNFIVSKEVTVQNFASSYWSYFDGRLTNKLDAVVVFNEIISQIKGGLGAKEALDGRLCKLDYTRLSKGRSTLSRKQREKIYDIFLDYEKMKNDKGEYDLADLVIDLHHRLEVFQYSGDQMDFVYVDEVQALTMLQITLLKYLCKNVNTGFVFSSNTAQTIAKGIDFRFQDIRFLFYKEFISRVKTDEKDIDAGLMKIPDILHMNQNCRTQPKILQLANSVTDLLFRFFPRCIDIVCPETSEMSSANFETPVLLENGNGQNVMTVLFEEGEKILADTREFGAKQVILVRDEHAREEISSLVGNQAIVVTIMECQCMEFQDVLLYNFFKSSPLGHQWRVIYQYMIEQDLLEIAPGSPNFNQLVQLDLCWELKLLHIAITRSRRRLWIYEDNQEFSNPIVDYWKKLCYVQVKTLDYSIVQAMTAPSTKEEWSSLGLEFFSEGVYGAASLCFERAEDGRRSEWARAASLCATAGILDASNPQIACNALREAAKIYISMDRAELAAKCYIELKEYKTAADTYLTKCGEAKFEDAGDCYILAKCYKLAAEAYSRGRCFLKFFDVCTAANLFDLGLQVICNWRKYDDVDLIKKCKHIEETWHLFLEKGALHYHQLQNLCSMMKFVKTFDSIDEKYSFLSTLGLSEKKLFQEEEINESVHKETISQNEGSISPGLQLQLKLESASLDKEASQNDTKKVANSMLTAKGSSRGSKFQPKLKSVWKETTPQNDTKTKDMMKVADNMSVAKGTSQGLQFQSKLKSKTISQNDTTIRDKMKVSENMSTAKGSSPVLKFQPKIKSVWKETTSQNDTKTRDNMKLADNMSTAKESSQGLHFQCKLELETISQNDMMTRDNMKVAENMSTAKGYSQRLNFQPKLQSVWKETSQNDTKIKDEMKVVDDMSTAKGTSQGLQLQSKLELEKVSQNDTTVRDNTKVAEDMSIGKGSSQGLKFEAKLKSVWKETTSQNDTMTKNEMKLVDDMSKAKGSSQGLQFQSKLELETVSQNNTTVRDNLKVAEDMSIDKGSSKGLKFEPKLKSVWKKTTSQNGTKTKDNMKLADNMPIANGSSQGLQFKSKLELKTVSQNDTTTMDKIQIAEVMSTSEGPSHGLQFRSKHVSTCKEKASQNDSKIGDNLNVAPFISTTKDTPNKLQFKPKLVYAKEEIAAQNDVRNEKDAVNIVNNKADASQKLQQCNQKLKNVLKETASSSDAKMKKDKMKDSVNLSEAGDPSQQLQIEQKKLKQKNVKAKKGKQKVADQKFIVKQYWKKVTENGMKSYFKEWDNVHEFEQFYAP